MIVNRMTDAMSPATASLKERSRLGGYREFAPPEDLRAFSGAVWSYWRPIDGPPIPGRGHRLPPNSDLNFLFARQTDERGATINAELFLVGPTETTTFFRPELGCRLDAVRMHPEWCRDLFGIDSGELIDNHWHFDSLLLDRLIESAAPLSVLLDALRRRCADRELTREARLAHAALSPLRRATRSTLSLDRIARRLSISERHLRRTVHDRAGISPKRLQRVVRIHAAIVSADRLARPDWATIACDCGFYDQPHMIQEFQSLVGCAPSVLLKERRLQTVAEISNPS